MEKEKTARKKSRRETGYTKPTRDRGELAKERYYKERDKRKKCRESKPGADTCKVCTYERYCNTESTEDFINVEKDRLSADNEEISQKEAVK